MGGRVYYLRLKKDKRTELIKVDGELPDSFYETYSAFANTEGGTIYLGITERKGGNLISGLSNPEEIAKNVLYSCHNPQKVSADLLKEGDVEILDLGGKKIVSVKVREAGDLQKPVYVDGSLSKSYKRKLEGDMLLGKEEIFHYLSKQTFVRKDMEINAYSLSIDDLSKDSLKAYQSEFDRVHPGV